jgi:hypothetical protein
MRGIQESVFEIPQPLMEAEQSGGAQNDGRPQESARIEERGAEPEKQTIGGPETRGSPTVSPQDQELVFEE